MEKMTHRNVSVNGINMHVAEIGEGSTPAVLFLHGFPELWYSWRHQMLFLSSKGYRAIAPDLRGFGETDGPPSAAIYSVLHIVGDLVGLLDAMELENVFLVGHDWGAVIAWWFCLIGPDRVKALVNMSVVFQPRHPSKDLVQIKREKFGDDHYMCRFQEVGVMGGELASIDTATLFKGVLGCRDPHPPRLPKHVNFGTLLKSQTIELPSWLTEEDINYFATKYKQKGFTGGLNYYRALGLYAESIELGADSSMGWIKSASAG